MEDDRSCSFVLDRLQALLRLERVYYELPAVDPDGAEADSATRDAALGHPSAAVKASPRVGGRGTYLTTLPESRRKIASWAYDVVDHFRFPREAVAWMMYYMDRMLVQCPPEKGPVDKEFLLLSVSSFYLAIKLVCKPSNSIFPVRIMVDIAKRQFTAQQIAETEYAILQGLNWHVHPPTADQFLVLLVQMCGPPSFHLREQLQDYANYLLELSVLYHCFLQYKPTEVAVAALHAASDLLAQDRALLPGGTLTAAPFLVSDPARVGSLALDAGRVAACRWHFSHVVRQQAPHLSSISAFSPPHSSADQIRTGSPVSVLPHATVNLPPDAQELLQCDAALQGSKVPPP